MLYKILVHLPAKTSYDENNPFVFAVYNPFTATPNIEFKQASLFYLYLTSLVKIIPIWYGNEKNISSFSTAKSSLCFRENLVKFFFISSKDGVVTRPSRASKLPFESS